MANDVDKMIDVSTGDKTREEAERVEYSPVYQVYENTRIPVSKTMGKLWHMRWDDCKKRLKQSGAEDRWDEVIAYYQNDQGGRSGKKARLSEPNTGRPYDYKYGSENIVFANISALIPSVYAKNPDVEITATKKDNEQQAKLFERLLDTLMRRKQAPGVNIKPKMKRLVTLSMLTNISYLEVGYVKKEDSTEEVVAEIEKLSKELSEAKKLDEIQEIEGKLQALEHKIALMAPAGPFVKVRTPDMVMFDGEDASLCDSNYVFIGDYIRTDFLRAMYGKKDEQGNWMSIYKPTHVLSGENDMQGHDDEINNFTLLQDGDEHEKFGYKAKEEFDHACRTMCWYVWDKTTRRVYLFNADDWSWPIWVWDDPYHLSSFFPIFPLTYYTDPKSQFGKSEVMYYLDQQDEINDINMERARMRHWISTKIFVNTAIIKDVNKISDFLKQDSELLVHGFELPENARMSDAISTLPTPSTQFEQLFDNTQVLAGINRISSVTPVLQNVQYKTNTTNKAIESYESSTQMRLDEKIDANEEILGDVGRAILELCVQFMTKDEVNALLGQAFVDDMGGWEEGRNVDDFNLEFNLEIIGGSTLKPTAKVKKEQAVQLGQILGQFANASPMIVIVMLKMMERAFGEDVVITPDEWNVIIQATQQQMQRGSAEGQAQGAQPAQEGQAPAEGQPQDMNQVMQVVEQVIDRLPPEAKQMLGAGIARGIPLKQLVQQLTQAAQGPEQRPQ